MTAADDPDSDRNPRDAAEDGHGEARPQRNGVVEALRDAHAGVRFAFETAARETDGSDPAFADALDVWIAANGHREYDRSEQLALAATQRATLLLQRVLQYERERRRSEPSGGGASTDRDADPAPLSRSIDGAGALDLDELADHLGASGTIAEFDGDVAELFASFPHDEAVGRRVAELVRTVEREPIEVVDGVLPGELYEELVPAAERKARGQFYTSPAIADALVRWALRSTDDGDVPRVLDPAAGCGTFAVAAYRHLVGRYPDADRAELLDRVVAVDVERFPLGSTARGLAALGGDAGRVRAYRGSFFDLEPGTDPAAADAVDALGAGGEVGLVDAIVGNPPYVEAGDLAPNREHFRAHLRELGPEGAAPYADGAKAIGANADAYVYFVTHATQFLTEGGRLAFIVPTKWMMSRYGEQFQAFLHDHYRIEAVVGFDARAFDDALVDTALLLLERCDDERERRGNVVEFVQLDGTVGPDALLEQVEREYEAPADDGLRIVRAETFRAVGVRQSALREADHGKIAHYLVAPEGLVALVESPELTSLGELADVRRGAMTGSTAFFFPDEDDVEAHDIEAEFLRPALKSTRGCETIAYDEDDVDRWFVDAHWYVEAVRDRSEGGKERRGALLEERVKRALEDDGYEGLRSWIDHAENAGEHRGATCERRDVWFDAGEPPRPEILFQKLLRERLFSIYNRVGAVPSNAVDCIDVHPDVDSKVLFGVLNSSLARAIMEVWGRNEAGMLQLMTYETKSLPVPDVRAMSASERDRIARVVDDVLDRGTSELSEADRDRLDAAVVDALDSVEISVERVQEIQRFALERRVGAGASTEVLVGEAGSSDGTGTRAGSPERGAVEERSRDPSDG